MTHKRGKDGSIGEIEPKLKPDISDKETHQRTDFCISTVLLSYVIIVSMVI